jgi:hypothetical protein
MLLITYVYMYEYRHEFFETHEELLPVITSFDGRFDFHDCHDFL